MKNTNLATWKFENTLRELGLSDKKESLKFFARMRNNPMDCQSPEIVFLSVIKTPGHSCLEHLKKCLGQKTRLRLGRFISGGFDRSGRWFRHRGLVHTSSQTRACLRVRVRNQGWGCQTPRLHPSASLNGFRRNSFDCIERL